MRHLFGETINKTGVYMIENIITQKSYIGSTSNSFKARFKAHLYDLRNNKHHCSKLQRAWNKYGEDSFVFMRLELCEPEDAISVEQYYIDKFKPFFNECLIAGSCKGVKRSDEVKQAISDRMKGNTIGRSLVMSDEAKQKISIANKGKTPANAGKPRSQETKDKISKAHKGRIISEETREKMSEKKKGKPSWNKGIKGGTTWNKGKEWNSEAKAKMSASKIKYNYVVENIESKEQTETNNLRQFAIDRNIHATHLQIGRTHKGYRLLSKTEL